MKRFMAGIVVGILLVTAMGAINTGGSGTYDVEVISDELVVIMDTRTSEIRVITPRDCSPFSADERTIRITRLKD